MEDLEEAEEEETVEVDSEDEVAVEEAVGASGEGEEAEVIIL